VCQLWDIWDRLDRVVRVPTLGSLTLEQWIEEFEKLRKLNREVMGKPKSAKRRKFASQQT
jgi:hypothetical protein